MSNCLPYPWQLDNWDAVMQQQNANRLPHALLVSGEKGSGKRHFVESLVRKLLCTANTDFACGDCKSCQLMLAGTHPGFIDITVEEKSKAIKIDQIRVLMDFSNKTAQIGNIKIAIIEPAEQMNANAANALLKCLEEPSGNSLIILLSHAPNRLLPTIRSRCQTLAMNKPNKEQSDKWLATFIADANQRQQLMMLANGNPLLALEYSDKEVIDAYKAIIQQLVAIQQGSQSVVQCAAEVDKMVSSDLNLWLLMQQKIIWQLVQASLKVDVVISRELQAFTALFERSDFQKRAYKMLEDIQQAITEERSVSNPNPLLLVEGLLIRWQALLRA
jgi:DNA polymerase-3 subunit delta'